MKKIILLFTLAIIIFLTGCSKTHHKEKYYQTQLCNDLGGMMEQSLLDRTRVDCLTDEYAIEVDFAKKWAESVGQSLHYAEMTNKKPGIGIIVSNNQKDKRHLKRLKVLAFKYDIKIFEINRGE